MCARFKSPLDLERLRLRFGSEPMFNLDGNPNLAPTETTPILRTGSDGIKWEKARFGLVPPWTKSLKSLTSLHNARAETVREKASFKISYQKRRCIIPAEGFYEWREEGGKKMPYYISQIDGELICFAGIWDYAEVENQKIFSFSIITGETTPLMEPYHDRMPLITDDIDQWLNLGHDALHGFTALADMNFKITPMDPAMNNARVKEVHELHSSAS
jgi:putative SOS response-associated peptidase YedK